MTLTLEDAYKKDYRIRVYTSAIVCDPEDSENYEIGWIDLNYSDTDLFDSRNDIRPIIDSESINPWVENFEEFRKDFVSELDRAGMMFDPYGNVWTSEYRDIHTGQYVVVTAHIIAKFFNNGWVEEDIDPNIGEGVI